MTTSSANQMWGGRFDAATSDSLAKINHSLAIDKRLAHHDVLGSMAHVDMLATQKIIGKEDGEKIKQGLAAIQKELQEGTFPFDETYEDIHMNIEARLKILIGDVAGKLHTARSRNDQVVTSFRLWMRDAIDDLDYKLGDLLKALREKAKEHHDTIMPGFTHLQPAQPVTFGFHMLAWAGMLARDKERLKDTRKRVNENPLGSAALAGTPFPIDRELTAKALGFDKVMANAMDGVSSRDFALEFLSTLAILSVHCSRVGEEMVNWMGWGFINLPDALTTGSSIMPNKKNPDGAELVRAKAGRVMGEWVNLMTVMKGLPFAYAKDCQEDKEAVFNAYDAVNLTLDVMIPMVREMQANKKRMFYATSMGFLTATDLADFLVRVYDIPFREAHHITGTLVKKAEEKSCKLHELTLSDMQAVFPDMDERVFECLSVEKSIASRTSYGGTAPENVIRQATNL